MINVQVEANPNENTISLLRRFNRKVQSSGVIQKSKKKRFNERAPSKYAKKVKALKSLDKRAKTDKLIRMGKLIEKTGRR